MQNIPNTSYVVVIITKMTAHVHSTLKKTKSSD